MCLMIRRLLVVALLAACLPHARAGEPGWTPLLDEKLSQWEKFLGIPEPTVDIPGYPTKESGKRGRLGLNNDPKNVYSTRQENGETILHVTGEVFGGLTTLQSYSNYHLRLQFRWGTTMWPPREKGPRDSGILYHCVGEHGAFWNVWKRSLECQIQENDIGDFFSIVGTMADIPSVEAKRDFWRYEPGAPLRPYQSRCARGADYPEKPNGEWNTLEIITLGTRAIHVLNGKVVNVLVNTRYKDRDKEIPLAAGQIQIQSEAAEIDYRRIEIRPITELPAEFRDAFKGLE